MLPMLVFAAGVWTAMDAMPPPRTSPYLLAQPKPLPACTVEVRAEAPLPPGISGGRVVDRYEHRYAWAQVLPSGHIRMRLRAYSGLWQGATQIICRRPRHWYAAVPDDPADAIVRVLGDGSVILRTVGHRPWPRRVQRSVAWEPLGVRGRSASAIVRS